MSDREFGGELLTFFFFLSLPFRSRSVLEPSLESQRVREEEDKVSERELASEQFRRLIISFKMCC